MSEPRLGASEFQRLLGQSRRTVFWALDEGSGPWELEPGEAPASGADWFFMVSFQRTGSSVAALILNRHTDVYCGQAHLILPLFMTVLHSRLLIAPDMWFSVRYLKKIPVTPTNVRELMDAWRRCVSDKRIFGDKGEMYHQYFGAACTGVFPDCKFVLTVRHPLDTLSSYIQQPWAAYMRADGNREAFLEGMRDRAREMLAGNAAWRNRAEVIEFERLYSEAEFRSTFSRVFTHLGADPTGYDWEGGWALCQHRLAFGRWERDREVLEFMDWLETRDDQLHRLLASGAYYLDDDLGEAPRSS
jgi:Sulfotransferase family